MIAGFFFYNRNLIICQVKSKKFLKKSRNLRGRKVVLRNSLKRKLKELTLFFN